MLPLSFILTYSKRRVGQMNRGQESFQDQQHINKDKSPSCVENNTQEGSPLKDLQDHSHEACSMPFSSIPEHEEQLWQDLHAYLQEEETHQKEHGEIPAEHDEAHPAESHSDTRHHHHRIPTPKENQAALDQFLLDLNQKENAEAKLTFALEFMEQSISQVNSPNFKRFWEARKSCLELFKDDSLSPSARGTLWNRYVELSKEARRLKDILDEQSTFAAEQIEIAIAALETDIQQLAQMLEKTSPFQFPEEARALKKSFENYSSVQRELNLLNAYASRINALRKELIRTEMRIRLKHKFFQRLSLAGDQVFPRRKELIKTVSQLFLEDIDQFISLNFGEKLSREPLFALREEIKALQGAAKILTLNTTSFTQTRTKLSECWDKIKVLEKEKKKERAKQKVLFKQNSEEVKIKFKEFEDGFNAGSFTLAEANQKLLELSNYMRTVSLSREEILELRNSLNQLKKLVNSKIKEEEDKRQQQSQEKDRLKKEEHLKIKNDIHELLASVDQQDSDYLNSEKDRLLEVIRTSTFNKSEKTDLEKHLKPLKDLIAEKKEKAIIALPDDDRNALEQLYQVYEERKSRRQEIKAQIEILRKAGGSSGLDFQKAIAVNEQLSEEKLRLDKINIGIKEIEDKISMLESKL